MIDSLESRTLLAFVSPAEFTNEFPADARVINVTNWSSDPTKNVTPNDGIDDTARIQYIFELFNNDSDSATPKPGRSMIYFPAGVYNVSNTIDTDLGAPYARPKIVGHSANDTIIRLAPNSPGYGAGANKTVLEVGENSNASFAHYVTDLAVDVGAGNPGAIALRFVGHNYAAVERVNLTAAPNSGAIGLLLGRLGGGYTGIGPHLTSDIRIDGFDYGIQVAGDGAVGLERVTLSNQRFAGVYAQSSQTPIGLRDVKSVQSGAVPVVLNEAQFPAPMTFLESHFINTSGGTTTPAIKLFSTATPTPNKFNWELKGVIQSGYKSLLDQQNVTLVAGTTVSEDNRTIRSGSSDTSPIHTTFSQTGLSLDLDVPDSPLYINHNFATDYVPARVGPRTTAAAENASFTAALNSGKPVVYLPTPGGLTSTASTGLQLSGTFTIPSSVQAIDFFYQNIDLKGNVTFIIEGNASDMPLTLRRFELTGSTSTYSYTIRHRGTRTLIMDTFAGAKYIGEPGAGNVFMNDVMTKPTFAAGQKAWIRQLDTEQDVDESFVRIDGAEVWIFNHKTEAANPVYKVTGGGKLETYVTKSVNPNASNPNKPMSSWDTRGKWYLDLIDSVASLAAVNTDSGWAAAWPDLIREKRGAVTQTFSQPNPGTGMDGYKYGLIVANPANAAIPAVPAFSVGSVAGTTVTLNWTNVTGETGYTIEYSTNPAFSQNRGTATSGVDTTTAQINSLNADTTYYFRIRAANASVFSARSAPVFASTQATTTAPAAPSNLTATMASNSQINLTWTDNSSNETGFEIERATDPGFTQNLVLVTTTAANVTSYSNTGLAVATTYYYRVRATNAIGDSANSNTANATTDSTVISNVTEDAMVRSYDPNATSPSVNIRFNDRWSYLKFNVTGLHGYRVQSAVLRMYESPLGVAGNTNFQVRATTSAWSESTVTWNTKPSTSSTVFGQYTGGQLVQNQMLDVTLNPAFIIGNGSYGLALLPTSGTIDSQFVAIGEAGTSPAQLLLNLVKLTPGDANGDGMVTIADLGTLASNWQMTGMTWADGDFTGDGVVSIADLGELATNWQAGVPAGPAVSSTSTPVAKATRPTRQPYKRVVTEVLA